MRYAFGKWDWGIIQMWYWFLIYDKIEVTHAFLILKKNFFGSRSYESWSPIRSMFMPCSLISKSFEVKHLRWWMTLDVVIMNRKFSQILSHSIIWYYFFFWYGPYPVTLEFFFSTNNRRFVGKGVAITLAVENHFLEQKLLNALFCTVGAYFRNV